MTEGEGSAPGQEHVSLKQLRDRGLGTLLQALYQRGGPQRAAQRLGITCSMCAALACIQTGHLSVDDLHAALSASFAAPLMPAGSRHLCRARSKRRMLRLGDLSGELEAAVPHVLQYGLMPNQAQLLEAGRPDLVQAVRVGALMSGCAAVLYISAMCCRHAVSCRALLQSQLS